MTNIDKKKLEMYRLEMYRKTLPPPCPTTVDEALELAIHAERMAKDVGAFDFAHYHFIRIQTSYENLAELLEKEKES